MEYHSSAISGSAAAALAAAPRSCLAQVRGVAPALGRAERAVAEYILAHPGRVVAASVADVAAASGVAVGTVMRVCAKLGFDSFPALKTALAVDLVQLGTPPDGPLEPGTPAVTVVRRVLELGAMGLRETQHALNWEAVDAAAGRLAVARRIDVYGAGPLSGPLAQIARYRFLLLGIPGSAETLASAQLTAAQTLRPDDVALLLSHSGVAVPVVEAARAARESGATTIAITNFQRSPLADVAEIVLFTAAHEPAEWAEAPAARVPMLALFEALYAATALTAGRRSETSRRHPRPPGVGREASRAACP